ncbi:transporter substrate-binding domain-containing protein [Maribacter aestuarii]|uniref:transporter substrate-binding domain-containing protein n=1 Tax=Maribacter aestuarii TaxID=1130723 RepID=UPI00248D06C1|nr:transporter substrate-binding domain-containing protein [Maribacter aestuarii]
MKRILYMLGFLCCLATNGQKVNDTLLVGFTPAAPFIVENEGKLDGLNVWLWKQVAKDIGKPYKMVQMNFSDMLDSLKTGGIDVSINPLTITSNRSKEMEFTHSFFASNSTVTVAQVSSFSKFMTFIKGFFNLNFLKGLFLLLLIILIFGFFGWYFERKRNPENFRPTYRGIWDGLWWSAVTLTTVGYGDKAPKTRMGKISALVLMFGGLLFISGLTASIASSLTVNQMSNNPEGFNEFKNRKVGTIAKSGTRTFLSEHFFKNVSTYPSVVPGLTDVKKGKIDAFLYDEPILKYRIQKDSSLRELQLLPIKFDVQFYAFGLPKTHTLLEQQISQRILEIMESKEWEIVLNEYGLAEL